MSPSLTSTRSWHFHFLRWHFPKRLRLCSVTERKLKTSLVLPERIQRNLIKPVRNTFFSPKYLMSIQTNYLISCFLALSFSVPAIERVMKTEKLNHQCHKITSLRKNMIYNIKRKSLLFKIKFWEILFILPWKRLVVLIWNIFCTRHQLNFKAILMDFLIRVGFRLCPDSLTYSLITRPLLLALYFNLVHRQLPLRS